MMREKSSLYKGVTRSTVGKVPWKAQIVAAGKCHYLGRFLTEEEAAKAYDNVAHYLNESARGFTFRLNFPDEYRSDPPEPTSLTTSLLSRITDDLAEITQSKLPTFNTPAQVISSLKSVQDTIRTWQAVGASMLAQVTSALRTLDPAELAADEEWLKIQDWFSHAKPSKAIIDATLEDFWKRNPSRRPAPGADNIVTLPQ